MSSYLKIIVALFGLAYLVSPMDIIPEIFIPYLGWLDDGMVLWVVYYLLRYNKLPDFNLFRKAGYKRPFQNKTEQKQQFQSQENTNSSKKTQQQRRQTARQPFEILGVSPDATKEQIQTAYKAAVKKYHPDKLSHLGEEFARLANKKFLEIQNAYDELMKKGRA